MTVCRDEAAGRVAALLLTAELKVEDAISSLAALAAEMPQARQAASLSMKFGQDAMTETAAAIYRLMEVRGHVIKAHDSLDAVQRKIGVKPIALGGWDKMASEAAASRGDPKIARVA